MPGLNENARLNQAAQQKLGLPEGFALYSPFPFGGMNVQASRIAIADQEFAWRENFIRIGDGNLRTTWDVGTALYTNDADQTIIYFYWFNIGLTVYCAVFFSDGTAIQVDTLGNVTTITSVGGTFYQSGGGLPACVSWGSQYLVIANNNTFNDYWVWDGTLLYTAGTCGPIIDLTSGGANYSSLPTVTAFGGQGSGIVVTPTILNGNVIALQVENQGSGYVPGDQVQLQFSGGGSDTGAILEAFLGSGSVSSVSMTDVGSGYTGTPTVTFSAPTGTTATGTAILGGTPGNLIVESVSISDPGAGYTTAPTVTFTGGGSTGAAAYAVVQNGFVVQVVVTDHGNGGYTSPPTVTFSAPPAATTATGTAVVSSDTVIGVTITDPGSGYTSPPTVTITGGSGSGATAVAYLAAGTIVSIGVENGGTNYTYPPTLSIVGGNGSGAAAVAVLAATTISHVNVTSGGGPYETAPTVNVYNTGTGGSGLAVTAIIADGQVIEFQVTNAGSGYTLPPLLLLTGGLPSNEGVQATGAAILTGTPIASVIISNQGSGYTQIPAVVVDPGSNNAASAIMEMMPFGVSGSAIESYQQRIWLPHPKARTSPPLTGNIFLVTAPDSLTDFATSDGGLIYTSTSSVLRAAYTSLKTVGDFLYPIGDSSTDVISNVQTSGNPATTTFNYNNTDPQTGTSWRSTIQDYSRTALYANTLGVFGLYGGAVTKLSAKLDPLFENAIFPPAAGAITPCAAVAEIHEKKVYLLLMTVVDPFTEQPRNVMVSWDEAEWFIVSQTKLPTFIGTQIINSTPVAWGTDGTSLFPLLSTPSASLTKILSTKLYGANSFPAVKLAMSLHLMAEDMSSNSAGVLFGAGSLDTENGPYPLPQSLNFGAGANASPVIAGYTGDIYGDFLGLTISSTSPDFALKHLVMGYKVVHGGFGEFNPGPAPGGVI